LRIAIDGFELDGNFTGVGRYLKNLLNAILRTDKENSYTLFKKNNNDPFKKNNLKVISLPSSLSYARWQNGKLIKALNGENFDLFFSPNHTIPLFYKGRSFMTVHDVSWKGVPKDFSLKEKFSRGLRTNISLRKCEKIFTVSEYSKKETIRFYKTPPEKIVPILSGIEDDFQRVSQKRINEFREKYGLSNGFSIGFLGSMFKRRHIPDLIKAFFILKGEFKIKLFLVGNIFDNKVKKFLKEKEIIHIDRINEEEIKSFYSSMDIFAYLSEYEGFGFPPLESLMCGTIPLLLRSSSLEEVFKDIAVFIQNPSPETIAKNISEIILKKEYFNDKIFGKFNERKNYFSWDRVAKEYLKHFK